MTPEAPVEKPTNLVEGPEGLITHAHVIARNRHKRPVIYKISNPEIYKQARQGLPLINGDERITIDAFTGSVNIFSFKSTNKIDEKTHLPIVLRIASRQPTIEIAIRKAVHIIKKAEQNEGEGKLKIPERTQKLINITQSLYNDFKDKTITSENLSKVRSQIEQEVSDLGFKDKPNFFVQKALFKINKALNYDSTNRFNPLISRTRLGSAKTLLEEFGILTDDVVKKYKYLGLELLFQEREKERQSIQDTIDLSESILNDPADFWIKRKQLEELVFSQLHPEQIRTAPYRLPAFWFVAYMFGFPKKDKAEMRKLRKLFQKMFDPNVTNETPYKGQLISQIDKIHKTKKTRMAVYVNFIERLDFAIKGLKGVLLKGEQELPF